MSLAHSNSLNFCTNPDGIVPSEEGGNGNALANGVINVDDDSEGIGEGGGGGEIGRVYR